MNLSKRGLRLLLTSSGKEINPLPLQSSFGIFAKCSDTFFRPETSRSLQTVVFELIAGFVPLLSSPSAQPVVVLKSAAQKLWSSTLACRIGRSTHGRTPPHAPSACSHASEHLSFSTGVTLRLMQQFVIHRQSLSEKPTPPNLWFFTHFSALIFIKGWQLLLNCSDV